MKSQIHTTLRPNGFTIDCNMVVLRIDFGAQSTDRSSIHSYSTSRDNLLTRPPGGDPCIRQEFL
jgi:hypothetical protein